MKRSIFDSRFGLESVIFALIAGLTQLAALPGLEFLFDWSGDHDNPSPGMTLVMAIRTPLAISLSIAIVVLGFTYFRPALNLTLTIAGFTLVSALGWFARGAYLKDSDSEPNIGIIFWDNFGWQNVVLSIGNFLWLVALVLAAIDFRAARKQY
jgi:hypothetical protein